MKKLTNYIIDLGRVVAYHPGLKKVTGSTTATVLLSQLLYWTDKAKNGWIYKTSDDIEEETGLTYNEQKTAKKKLKSLGIISYKYKRLDHETWYKVNEEVLNSKWEAETGTKSETVIKNEEIPVVKEKETPSTNLNNQTVISSSVRTSAVEKKGDLLDGMLNFQNSPAAKKENDKKLIKEKIEKKLHINVDNIKWERFIDFLYTRETKHNEPVDRFLEWAINNGFDPVYWTAEKMKTLHPRAFIHIITKQDFIEKLPERKEEVYAPMPKDLGRKRELF